jgi:diguanylate cyclase (GGDEF)-like protein
MFTVEPLLAILAAAIAILVVLAALLTAALLGRGPLYGRFPRADHAPTKPAVPAAPTKPAVPAAPAAPAKSRSEVEDGHEAHASTAPRNARFTAPNVRLVSRDRRPIARADAPPRPRVRPNDDSELDEVLRGSFGVETYGRAVRVLAWSFILAALLIVVTSQLWQPAQPQIFATLIVAGVFVLVVDELAPPGGFRTARIVMEGSAAILFLTMLVLLTGHASSPFFFLYPLLVGGAALIASPTITLILTVETVLACGIAALSGPMEAATARDTLVRVGVNLTALVLLSYSGMIVARVQRRTRDAAIRLSTVDSLTELHNRAFFFNAVDHEIQRCLRFGRGFCLLMMDLDGLKSINDRYGHYQGDLVLRVVAELIRTGLRGVDVAARYGGDEFVALLPETDPSGAYVVAEKIRQLVSELLIESGGHQIATSLSIGVVSYPDDGETADELMIAADEAMYSSKRLGKNRVVGYAQPGEPAQPSPAPHRTPVPTPGFRPLRRADAGEKPEDRERR